jgi:anti-anti-sigma factor
MRSLRCNEVWRPNGSVVLTLEGVVDDDTAEQFENRLQRAISTAYHQLIVDVTACRLDSAGLEALKHLRTNSRDGKPNVVVVATDANLLRTLRIVGLDSELPIDATRDGTARSNRALRQSSRVDRPTPDARRERTLRSARTWNDSHGCDPGREEKKNATG